MGGHRLTWLKQCCRFASGNSCASGGIYAAVNFKHLGKTDGERHVVDGKGPISRRLFCYLGLSEIVILSGVLMALAPASNARKAATALCIA